MLQIPFSAYSLVSLTSKVLAGLCGGFFIGSQVVFTQLVQSIPKNHLSATRTASSMLLPTKCALLTPGISTGVPCIAVVGYASVVLASLFCILRAKSFLDTSSQPPSPPPDSGSTISQDSKHGRSWILWIILIMVGLAILALALVSWLFADDGSLPESTASWVRGLIFMERTFVDSLILSASFLSLLSAARVRIIAHAYQYTKIILLALAIHSVCVVCAITLDRLRRSAIGLAKALWFPFCVVYLNPFLLIAFHSSLNWIYWVPWYCLCGRNVLPSVFDIHQVILRLASLPGTYESAGMLLVFAPMVVHAGTMGLSFAVLGLFGIPSAATHIIWTLSDRRDLRVFLCHPFGLVAFSACYTAIAYSLPRYMALNPEQKQLLWNSVWCAQSRLEVRRLFGRLLHEPFKTWKATQIDDFYALVSTLGRLFSGGIATCVQTWRTSCWGHRLLIVVPALIFYTYFYFIPMGRDIQIWRRSRHRR
ncbi:hypothetical protein B0H15DRAFT_89093 [Mycena belliarum]|uniref:Uncharacterized protein n=1 Tax=Mycena belliarum TaxID=1033014 RepID=A0AAD6TQU6_9AGAR|nr:hypothetical protein B0H15DRAFT_89093 [Mycena belliae]